MATGAVAVIAGSKPGHELIRNLLAERIQLSFDGLGQVHRVALPQPGDDAALFRAIAHALERPLDVNGPRWECWVIERLEGNRWAILMKVDHSIAHAIPPAHLLARLCDEADSAAFTDTVAGQQDSTAGADRPSWVHTLMQTPLDVAKAAVSAAATMMTWPEPAGPVNTLRHYSAVRVPRAAVDRMARKFGVSADEVAVAAITEGFRGVLVQHGHQPRADSVRTVGAVLPFLPVDHEDPLRQLRAVRPEPNRASQPFPSPFKLCAKAVQSLMRPPGQHTVTLAIHAFRPRERLRLMGRQLERLLPIPPTAPEFSTGISVIGYADELVFGLIADYHAAADLARLAGGIELGMARLLALGQDSVLPFDRRRKRPGRVPARRVPRPSTAPVRARRR